MHVFERSLHVGCILVLHNHPTSINEANRNNSASDTLRNRVCTMPHLRLRIGYTCDISDVDTSRPGCCNLNAVSTSRYSCESCSSDTNCCLLYEHCVACCMHPDRRSFRAQLRRNALLAKFSRQVRSDPFALCAAACRSNSRSVVHENAYKNSQHHCYDVRDPPIDGRLHMGLFDFAAPLQNRYRQSRR